MSARSLLPTSLPQRGLWKEPTVAAVIKEPSREVGRHRSKAGTFASPSHEVSPSHQRSRGAACWPRLSERRASRVFIWLFLVRGRSPPEVLSDYSKGQFKSSVKFLQGESSLVRYLDSTPSKYHFFYLFQSLSGSSLRLKPGGEMTAKGQKTRAEKYTSQQKILKY